MLVDILIIIGWAISLVYTLACWSAKRDTRGLGFGNPFKIEAKNAFSTSLFPLLLFTLSVWGILFGG